MDIQTDIRLLTDKDADNIESSLFKIRIFEKVESGSNLAFVYTVFIQKIFVDIKRIFDY